MTDAKKPFHTRAINRRFGGELRGLGAQQLFKQRGLRGVTLGPASPGRRLTADERKAAEQKLRDEGLLP